MIFIALFLSPIFASKHGLLDWIGANVDWDSKTEPYMAPKMTKIDPKFGPVVFLAEKSKIKKVKRSTNLNYRNSYPELKQKVGNQQPKEKRKFPDILNFLNKYTCIKTFNTKLIKNCAYPIEIKF